MRDLSGGQTTFSPLVRLELLFIPVVSGRQAGKIARCAQMHPCNNCTPWLPPPPFHPPPGRGLTMTLKGLCLATVIATPQARVALRAHLRSVVHPGVFDVCSAADVNSCRHPWSTGLSHGCFFFCLFFFALPCGLFTRKQP